ncbi:MAG TPA: ectoine/hydroxyectoine ABC transporter permease subunit EhuD [Nocardioidaceae bacterium]|nr:ectoine/hydroxyectoine ABC transporter permease subunit EhuD [Nocardioidaceae bacterium]
MSEIWNWNYAFSVLPELLEAFVKVTLVVTVLGTLLAATLGLVFALVRHARIPVLSPLLTAFIEFVRSTPVLIQLFFLFFILPDFGILLSAMVTGVIGLGVHYACYYTDVYRAGIDAVPVGQWEAATSLHLSRRRTWQRVVLPQAIRNVLPSLGNYAIAMFKETPYVSLIGVVELVGMARQVAADTSEYLEPLTMAGAIFLAASYPTALLLRRLERYLETSAAT